MPETSDSPVTPPRRVALLWRGAPGAPTPAPSETRFRDIFAAFAARDVEAQPVLFSDATAEAVRERLLDMDAVLVWVDPIVGGEDRSTLDALLREVAASGVYVSAHPDTILALGTKEILHTTRHLPFGTDSAIYHSLEEMRRGLPDRLRAGPRVIKQDRGSSGNGVWKLSLTPPHEASDDPLAVSVQAAERGAVVREMSLDTFIADRGAYFGYFGGRVAFVDQPYVERVADGMTRCYMVHDRIAGFGLQKVTALVQPPPGSAGPPDPEPRRYVGPDHPPAQALRRLMEGSWIEALRTTAGLDHDAWPAIWDADFLLGPPGPDGADTYLLCEVNVSGVFPIPPEAVAPLVDATIARARARRARP